MISKKLYLLLGSLVLGVLAVGLTTTAFAQDTQPPDESAHFSGPFGGKMRRGGWGGMHIGQTGFEAAAGLLGMSTEELTDQLAAGSTLADLAEKVGLDLQTLRESVENTRFEDIKTLIQQAVSDGNMTQEEADWLLRGIENGYRQGFGRGGFGMKAGGNEVGVEAAANALGMDVEDLSNQLWAGRTLAEIAENAGVELQTVLDTMQNAHLETARERISTDLANGTITQEQADWMLEGLENGYGRGPQSGFQGRGSFGGRMPGGMRGCPNFQPSESSEGA